MITSRRINLFLAYASSGVGFATALLAARVLGAVEYAWLVLGVSVGIFGNQLVNLGSDRALVRDAARLPRILDRNRLLHRNLGLRVAAGAVVFAVIVGGAAVYTHAAGDMVALCSLAAWATLLGLYPSAWYDLTGNIALQNSMILAESSLALSLVATLAVLPEPYRRAQILGPLLLGLRVVSLIVQQLVWWRRAPSFRFRWACCCRKSVANGVSLPITIAVLANALLSYGNQILLAGRGNRGELAACGMALQVMNVVILFQTQGIRFMTRSVAAVCLSPREVPRSLIRLGMRMFGASIPLSLLAGLLLWFLPFALRDTAYLTMRALIVPLCVWVVLVGFGQVTTLHMAACKLDRVYVVVTVAVGVMSIAIGSRVVPRYGASAVAWLLLLMHGFSMAVMAGVMFLYPKFFLGKVRA